MDEIIKNSFKTFFHHKIHDFGDMKMHKNLCQQLVPGSHDFILIFPVLMNNALRKIFGFRDWRSIRTLREIFNFKSLYDIFKLAKDRFLISCSHSHNPIISHLFSVAHWICSRLILLVCVLCNCFTFLCQRIKETYIVIWRFSAFFILIEWLKD